jgi:DNA-binding NarL/FixJ family response regulator
MSVRAMIVDDQADVRLLLRVVIESMNDVVIACEAATGDEALDIIETCDPRVVVLDQMMPGLNGVETAERMLARRPEQLVVLCSAYLNDEIAREAKHIGIAALVHKDDVRDLPSVIHDLVA